MSRLQLIPSMLFLSTHMLLVYIVCAIVILCLLCCSPSWWGIPSPSEAIPFWGRDQL